MNNAEAREFSDSHPERSLAAATKAHAAAKEAGDVRGEAEALNYMACGYRNQSVLELSRQCAFESVRLYGQAGVQWGEAQGYNTLGLIEADSWLTIDALDSMVECDSLLTGPTLTVPVLATISRPILIAAAGHDTFFATAVAENMHAHIRAPS